MNSRYLDDTARVRRLVNHTRNLSKQPGDKAPFSGTGSVAATVTAPLLDTRPDDDGNTIAPLIWGVDSWGEGDWS